MLNYLYLEASWFVYFMQESKLYGSHFKEITADAPKSTKITFSNSDDEDWWS